MVNFSSLKKSSADISRLTKEIEKLNGPAEGTKNVDDRYWKPTLDKAGNGFAVIRFLPAPAVDGDDALPWVRIFSHGFQGPGGKWYIESSLTTLGQKDPVGELNSSLWNSTEDPNSPARKQASAQKRKLQYVSNILVVSDPKNPENEGKVFLFKYGKKIFNKISEAMHPPYDDQGRTPENPDYNPTNAFSPFNLWTGANLKLQIKSITMPGERRAFPNYDSSVWAACGPVMDDDAKLEEIWKSEYSLKELISPDKFKSYDELKARLTDVLGNTEVGKSKTADIVDDDVPFKAAASRKSVVDDEDDEDMAYFKKMASE